jgi:hypothetical protein
MWNTLWPSLFNMNEKLKKLGINKHEGVTKPKCYNPHMKDGSEMGNTESDPSQPISSINYAELLGQKAFIEQSSTAPTLYKPPRKKNINIPEHGDVPVQMGYAENIPGDYVLPEELWWVGYYASTQLDALDRHPAYFHGTRLSRVEGIKADAGLKMHPESTAATPDPILAAHHAYENGPEDSNNPAKDKRNSDDPVFVLKLNIDNYPPDELERYRRTAHMTYRGLRAGRESNYVGLRMGQFVPIEILSVIEPSASGEVIETPLSDWQASTPAQKNGSTEPNSLD